MAPNYDFSGKHFMLTGASSGIGQQAAWDLSTANAALTLLGRNTEKLQNTKEKITQSNVEFISGDLCKSTFIEDLCENVSKLDGLILCAGIIDYTPIKMISTQKIRKVFDINFDANVLLIQSLLKKKKINPNASIVIISSISSKLGVAGTALYAASKAAIAAFGKVLATELAPKNIRVNIVHPGIVKTNLISDSELVDSSSLTQLEATYPLGFGEREDVSNQILFLLSGASRWTTGAEFVLDGGHTIVR